MADHKPPPDAAASTEPATQPTPKKSETPGADRQTASAAPGDGQVTTAPAPPDAASTAPVSPPRAVAAQRTASAVLDEAHLGDIRGALGTIRMTDWAPRRTWRARLVTLLAIMGPGLIVMVGDNDAGGVATYAQAGQNYGYSLLWTLLLLIPVLIVNQEMVVLLAVARPRSRRSSADDVSARS